MKSLTNIVWHDLHDDLERSVFRRVDERTWCMLQDNTEYAVERASYNIRNHIEWFILDEIKKRKDHEIIDSTD